MKHMTLMAALALGLTFGGQQAWAEEGQGGHGHAHAEVGHAAPDFTLADLDGKEYKLADLKGKVVVLEWTNFTCPFVVRHQKQKKTMQSTFAQLKDKEVVWLAIDSTRADYPPGDAEGHTPAKIKAWTNDADVQLPYPVLRDADGKVGHAYNARTTPHMFVIDREGVLVYAGAIDDDPAGRNADAVNYVTAAVEATLAGSKVEIATTKAYGCGVKYAQ